MRSGEEGDPGPEFEPEPEPEAEVDGPAGGGEADEVSAAGSDDETSETVDRTTVRITRDVGEIFGVDERSYELTSEDVVTLPEANADPLVEKDAAEKLD
jgi:DNA replication factor GINS